MPLPDLTGTAPTRSALHQAMQVLRAARLLGVEPLPNELEYSTIPTPDGATTGKLSFGGALRLDFRQGAIVYETAAGERFRVPLAGHTQTSLFDAVFDALREEGHDLSPGREKITGTEALTFEPEPAARFATVMAWAHDVLARTKAHFLGQVTPIALWPHGFDLSTLWFAAGSDEQEDPHINFGFSPFTPDVGQPYFYATAWPVPTALPEQLPALASWQATWSTPGLIIPYDRAAALDAPARQVEAALVEVYETAGALLRDPSA